MKDKANGAAVAPDERQRHDSDALKSAMAELCGQPTPQSTVADVRACMNPYGGAFVNLAFSIYGRNGHPKLPLTDLRTGIAAARDFLNRCAARFPAECGRATAGMAMRIDDYLNGCGSSIWMTAFDLIKAAKQLHVDLAGVTADGGEKMFAAIQDVAKQEAEHHKENMNAHSATHARLPKPPRADKGSKPKRTYRKAAVVNNVRLTAKRVAGWLNKAKFQPEKGAGCMGACSAKKIQQWDEWCADHPGERNLWGYMTELRTDEKRYDDLIRFCQNWDGFWKEYKAAFYKWRINNPDKPRANFKPSRELMKRFDIDPERMGEDEDGTMLIRPVSDDEKMRLRKVMCRRGLSRKNLGRQYQMN